MQRSIIARFGQLFIEGFGKTLAAKVVDGTLLIFAILYAARTGSLQEGRLGELATIGGMLLCAVSAWSASRAGVLLTRAVAAETVQEAAPKNLGIFAADGLPLTVSGSEPYPGYRSKIWGFAALVIFVCVAIFFGLVASLKPLSQPGGHRS